MAAIATYGSGYLGKRQRFEILRAQLQTERAPTLSLWRDLARNILPTRVRQFTSEAGRTDRKNQDIMDATPVYAARTLRAGMMGGITSPARPWHRLTTPDPDLAEFPAAKAWLETVTERQRTFFLRSNLYNVLPIGYGDCGVFGTSAIFIEPDREELFRCYALPLGSYYLACDARGRVNTLVREFSQTVRQVVEKFGMIDERSGRPDWSNISPYVHALWDQGAYDSRVDIIHIIMPNVEYDPGKLSSKFKKFTSCYYESGGSNAGTTGTSGYLQSSIDQDRILRESGYDFFPVLAPRWEVTADDPYGSSCPGIDAIGDIRQLYKGEKRIQEAIEKMNRPPMTGPTSLLNREKSILPGSFTPDDSREGSKGYRSVFNIDPRIQEMEFKQGQCRDRIKKAFFEDLFLMMAQDDRSGITATEINERKQEKLVVLGPVLEQLNQDQNDPLIDITFGLMAEAKQIPPPPPELQGMPLKVEYISIMAQAQKLAGLAGIERYLGFITNVAAVNQQIVAKVDFNHMADAYADATGISPKINRPTEDAEAILAQQAKAQQAQATMEMAGKAAGTARDLSQTDTESKNALTDLLQGSQAAGVA